MTRKSIFNGILTAAAVGVLAIGVSAQGKHGGKKHGGDHGNRGGGKQEKQWNGGDRGGKQNKQWNGGNRRGNDDRGKSWGRQPRFDGSREVQMQIRQQQRQQQVWAKEQQKAAREQFKQQRNYQRDQQREYQRAERDQRRYQQQQYRTVIRQFGFDDSRLRRDNGKHNGWVNGQPRGNHYGWYSQDEKRFRKQMKKAQKADRYRYYDPLVSYVPVYRGVDYYQYQPQREYVVRSIISTFFAPNNAYYDYYPAPRTYSVYQPYQPRYYETVSYSPAYDYYDPGYGYGDLYYGSQMFGDGDLKSSLLNIGFGLLQGFLGQGYLDGLNQGMYAREVYGPRYTSYYNPYEAPAEYYSPYVSSFADERQIFEEGYRLGYEDGLRARDPYAAYDGGVENVDLISAFLTNTLLANV